MPSTPVTPVGQPTPVGKPTQVGQPARDRWPLHALFLLVLCALIYFPWLGTAGFASSEGHRVVPGWTMVDSGDWTRLEMFERTYIRKPPGMPWAIGAFALAFGQNEWSARAVSAVSATLCVLVCWLFSRSWFGPRPAVYAGAAQALLPLLWLPGGPARTAEIEMLLLLGTQLAALSTMHVLMGHERGASKPRASGLLLCSALTFLGIVIAALAKGLAALPVLIGVLAGASAIVGLRCLHRGGVLALIHRAAMLLGIGVGTGLVLWIFRVNDHPDAVRETGSFLWTDPLATLTSAPIAFVSAAPVSIAMLWVFGPDARREAASKDPHHPFTRAFAIARALAFAWLLAAAIYTVLGVSNPRYLLPASVLFAPIVGYVVMGMQRLPDRDASLFTPARRRLARVLLLDAPGPRVLASGRAWVALLVIGALTSAYLFAHRAEAQKSRQIGREIHGLCEALNAQAVIADGVIEARPDVLLYAARSSRQSKQYAFVHYVWDKPGLAPALHAPLDLRGVLTLSRADVNEHAPYRPDDTRSEWTLGRYRLILHGSGWGSHLHRDESDYFPEPSVP